MAEFVIDHHEVAPVLPRKKKSGAGVGLLGVNFQVSEMHLILEESLMEDIADSLQAPLLEVLNAVVVCLGLLAVHYLSGVLSVCSDTFIDRADARAWRLSSACARRCRMDAEENPLSSLRNSCSRRFVWISSRASTARV
jgi:hypothetical protein